MIIEKVERPVFTAIDATQRRFRIDESGLVNILSILRKNMYANPTRIIVQEYANNARDAHVAAKVASRPIQITCPTQISPYLKIRDYGYGIPPELIDEVFVSYGASTKRDTNEQIGGFGLGAKSAFSYCDAFEVTTICNGIKYIYTPFIDSSDIGEMPLIAQEETDEESGTMISIHIRNEDIYRVTNAISMLTEYWDVRPEIIGNVNYSNRKVYFSEDNWSLLEKAYSSSYSNEILYCVEGIPYTFSLPSEDERFDYDMRELSKCPFIVKLKTGDVTIASNREALVSDEKTLNKIHEILTDINTRFRNHVMESISKCENLKEMFEMRSMYNRLRLDHMVKSFNWRGIDINGNYITVPPEAGKVYKIRLTRRGVDGYVVKSKEGGDAIDFSENSDSKKIFAIKVEEGKSYNKNQLLNAMLVHNDIVNCQLVVLRVDMDDPILEAAGFGYFEFTDLSTFSTKNEWRPKRFGIRSERVEYYSFSGASRKGVDCWTREFGEVDELIEGVYFPLNRGKFDVEDSYSYFSQFEKICDLPFYGMPKRAMKDAEANPNLISYDLYLLAYCMKLVSYLNENREIAEAIVSNTSNRFNDVYSYLKGIVNHLPADHCISMWKRFSNPEITDEYRKVKEALHRYDFFKNFVNLDVKFEGGNKIEEYRKLVQETYPILKVFNEGREYETDSVKLTEAAVEYIASVDRRIALMDNN